MLLKLELALTVSSPIDASKGTLKVSENFPLPSAVTVPVIAMSSKVIATGTLGTNPVPVISTEVPTGPEVGLRVMAAEPLEPEALKFHSQLSSTPFDPKQSKKLPFWSSIFVDIDAM